MRGPEGGFYSALDADSEGVEGLFYTWTPAEAQGRAGSGRASITPSRRRSPTWGSASTATSRAAAFSTCRSASGATSPPASTRPSGPCSRRAPSESGPVSTTSGSAPGTPSCSARSPRSAPRSASRATSTRPANAPTFILDDDAGRATGACSARYNNGEARLNAYLEDHAYLLEALLTLYEATFEPRWFEAAREIADAMIERFGDADNGGFFTTSDDHEELIARRKDLDDHPAPSGNSSAAAGLLRLAALTGEADYEEQARRVLVLLADPAGRHPQGLTYLLAAIDRYQSPGREVALIAPAGEPSDIDGPRRRRCAPATGPGSCWRAASRARRSLRCSPTGPRSAARPPPTSASTSAAAPR